MCQRHELRILYEMKYETSKKKVGVVGLGILSMMAFLKVFQ